MTLYVDDGWTTERSVCTAGDEVRRASLVVSVRRLSAAKCGHRRSVAVSTARYRPRFSVHSVSVRFRA